MKKIYSPLLRMLFCMTLLVISTASGATARTTAFDGLEKQRRMPELIQPSLFIFPMPERQ